MSPRAIAPPDLAAVGARLGADPMLVQAAGGNVSFKQDGVMWIKASGTWLAEAERRDIMVPVALGQLLAAFADHDPACETCVDFVRQDLNANGLRPSIETTMHAVLPQAAVLHVHCVETLAWAIRADAAEALKTPLAGLSWCFVPYIRPGVPLTRAIVAALGLDTRVLVLGNHGLVVAGDTLAEAEALLADVVGRLRRPKQMPAGAPDLERLARVAGEAPYRPAASAALHAVALDPDRLALAQAGSLYPDHVIFLGSGTVSVAPDETAAAAVSRARREGVPLLLVPGAGVLVHTEATAAALALAECLAQVVARTDTSQPISVLTLADDAALLGWDAEKYRQSLSPAATA